MFFEIELTLSDRFHGLTPFSIRREKSGEVFKLLERYGRYIERDREENGEIIVKDGKRILRRKAGDDWF